MAHVNRIARADSDSSCRCLLINGCLGEGGCVQAIDEEAVGWVRVAPAIDSHEDHEDEIEERE